jgi:integrase
LAATDRKAKLPKGVWFQRKVLATGEVIRYGYHGRGGELTSLGREGSADFHDRVADLLRRRPAERTVADLIFQYRQSPDFKKLRTRTKADYVLQLDKIAKQFGPLSTRAIGDRSIARHLYQWRDSMAASPRRADYAIQVLKILLAWSTKRGLVELNRAAGIEKLYVGDRSHIIWSDDQVADFLKVAPEPMQRALILGLETGQRQADLLRLTWGAIEGDLIHVKQRKGGAPATVPISAVLRQCLDQIPRSDALTVLTKHDGLPFNPTGNGFRNAFRDESYSAGIRGYTFHDLRGTFATRRLAEGWTVQEVAMCTGHSLRDLASLDRYVDRQTATDANAMRIVERAARAEREQKLQTDLQTASPTGG